MRLSPGLAHYLPALEVNLADIGLTGCHASKDDESDKRPEGVTEGPNDQHAQSIDQHGQNEGIHRTDPIGKLAEQDSAQRRREVEARDESGGG